MKLFLWKLIAPIVAILVAHAPTSLGNINNPPTSGPNGNFLQASNNLNDVANATTSANSLFNAPGIGVEIGSTTSPTAALTFPAGSTGIQLFNTADQTTNTEKAILDWNSNSARLRVASAGTGANRSLILSAVSAAGSGPSLTLNPSTIQASLSTGGIGLTAFNVTGSWSAASGQSIMQSILGTLTQSGTAGYTALLINPTETGVGSGTKRLISGQVGSTDRFVVNNNGDTSITGASSSTLVIGGTSNNPGCIEMGDSDNSGISYITAANGVLSATTTKPSFCL